MALKIVDALTKDKVNNPIGYVTATLNKAINELVGAGTRASEFAGMGFFNVPKTAFVKNKYLIGEF